MRPAPIRPALVAALALFLSIPFAASPAGAVVRSWVSAVSGHADNSLLWNPMGIPGAGDNLIFPVAGAYAVLFPTTVPTVISHDYRAGVVSISATDTHTCSSSFGVGQTGSGGVNVTGGTFQASLLHIGGSAGVYGRLTLTHGGGISSTPPSAIFQQTDSTMTSTYGDDGIARLEIIGGAMHSLEGAITMANTSTAICTLTVAGNNPSTLTNATLVTNNPRRNVTLGATGHFVGNIDEGGILHIAGTTWIGQRAGSVAYLDIGAATTTLPPSVRFDGLLRIGDTGFLGSQGGTAEVRLYTGSLDVEGLCTIGDPDGTPSSVPALRVYGGTATFAGGVTRYSPTDNTHLGGTERFISGPVTWGGTFTETGPAPGPLLYLENGAADSVMSDVIVGKNGVGRMRVTRPGTVLGSATSLIVADSLGGSGTIELDSSAVARCSIPMYLGRAGAATVSVRGGALLGASQIDCALAAGSTSNVSVSGAGSALGFQELFVGGEVSTGGVADVVVDSSGVAAGQTVHVFPTSTLDIRHGGLVEMQNFIGDGDLQLDGGTLQMSPPATLFLNSVHGRGTLISSVQASGPIDTRRAAGTYGRLNVQGDFIPYNSRTTVGIGRPGTPRSDTISVSGNAGLLDTLDVEPDGSFLSVESDGYTIATWGSNSGTFSPVLLRGSATAMSDSFLVVYGPNSLVLIAKYGSAGVGGGPAPVKALSLRALGSPGPRPAFSLQLPKAAIAHVTVLDVSGRVVGRLQDGPLAAGEHRFDFASRDLPAGMYLARAVIDHDGMEETRTAKATKLR